MYLDFYGLREPPFSLTPDPRFIFLSKSHREAFAHLLYGISHRTGFVALTGEVGTGKTTVVRTLLSQLDPKQYCTALIFNPCLSPAELLQTVAREFAIPKETSDPLSALDALNLFLLNQNAEGRTAVLVIDEAQDLEEPVLEQIRLISNLETDREKLIQIVLVGQPELIHILDSKGMRQLGQRITLRCHLEPMDFNDTVRYIHHRLEVAGGRGSDLFSKRSLKRIYKYSRGFPRLINAACDRALLAGYARDKKRISVQIASEGIREMGWQGTRRIRKKSLALATMVTAFLILTGAGIYLFRPDLIEPILPSKLTEATAPHGAHETTIVEDEFFRFPTITLEGISEWESARRAFNALAELWGVSPMAETDRVTQLSDIEHAARSRKVLLYHFSGNLGTLLRINYPAALELSLPGVSGKRFVSIVGVENDRLLVTPSLGGRRSLGFSEIERHWSGRGFLLWKDLLNLLPNGSTLLSGARGAHIRRLQELLKEAGVYHGAVTGVYDRETFVAVRALQSSAGIEEDGVVGGQTLMVLYGSIDRFRVPRLTAGIK